MYVARIGALPKSNARRDVGGIDKWSLVLSPPSADFRRWMRDGLRLEPTTRGFVVRHMTGLLVGPLVWIPQFRTPGHYRPLSSCRRSVNHLALTGAFMSLRMHIEDFPTRNG